MSVADMQHAVITADRVGKILVANAKRTGVEMAYELNKANSSAVYTGGFLTAADLSLTHLVPGGRFYVVAKRDDVSVWDIGFAGSTPLAFPQRMISVPYAVAQGSAASDNQKPITLDVQSAQGESLKVAVIWSVAGGTKYRCVSPDPTNLGCALTRTLTYLIGLQFLTFLLTFPSRHLTS